MEERNVTFFMLIMDVLSFPFLSFKWVTSLFFRLVFSIIGVAYWFVFENMVGFAFLFKKLQQGLPASCGL
jgi:hypothetical protein